MKNLDLDLLRTLDVIARQGTFAAAAGVLHRTQAAITQKMQRLEAEVGCPLFEKVGRGKRLTPMGMQLLAYARPMLALNDQALAAAEAEGLGEVPVLRIGSPHDVAETLLTSLLTRFIQAMPDLQMTIEVGRSPFLVEAMEAGGLDMTLSTRWDDRYPGLRLRSSPTVWVCAHDFVYEPGLPVPLVLADEPSLFRKLALESLSQQGVPWRVRFLAPNLVAIRAAVRAGLGITARSVELLDGQLRVLGAADGLPPLPEVNYYLYIHPGHASRAARVLFQALAFEHQSSGPALLT